VARIYSGFTVMGTRALGRRHKEIEIIVHLLLLSANSLALELVSKP